MSRIEFMPHDDLAMIEDMRQCKCCSAWTNELIHCESTGLDVCHECHICSGCNTQIDECNLWGNECICSKCVKDGH